MKFPPRRPSILGDTWIDPEEYAYPAGSLRQSRRKGLVRFPDGKLRIVTLGVPDTYSTIPARASNGRHGFVQVSSYRLDGPPEYQFIRPAYLENKLAEREADTACLNAWTDPDSRVKG